MTDVMTWGDQFRSSGTSYEFQGYQHGEVGVSFIVVNGSPGSGPALHRHPYAEVFVVLEGQASFTVDDATIEATAGQIVIVPPGRAHKYVNAGDRPLRQVDIHSSERFVTEWLDKGATV